MPNIVRSSPSSLSKLLSGGGRNYAVPNAWSNTAYGSGFPIAPVSAPTDVELPRTIDYPISVNATLTPRTAYGLMPFAALLAAYENVSEVSAPVQLIQRQLTGLTPRLVDDSDQPVEDHPYAWMTKLPDRRTPFNVWLSRFIKSAKIYDAASVYLEQNGGKTDALHYIDGSTLFVLVDQFGNIPEPEPVDVYVRRMMSEVNAAPPANSLEGSKGASSIETFIQQLISRTAERKPIPAKIPAFTQVIQGTPFSWWSQDEVWYMPQSRRVNAPYGESYIELAWSWIMLIVNITAFELGHYRTGNMPEGFITLPAEGFTTVDAVMAAEMMYNQRMASNPATERNRLRFFPGGSTYQATKKPDFPLELYSQAWHNLLNAIGVLPSEFEDMPGSGLGGKGMKEQSTADASRQSINPNREFVASLFNDVLERDGVDDVHFTLDYAIEEVNPDKQKLSIYDGMAHGTLSLNDALGQLGLPPIGNPDDLGNIANKHLIVAGSTIYVIEDMQTQDGVAVPVAGGGNQAGGVPFGIGTDAEHTPQDHQTLRDIIRHVRETGTLDGTFTSVPVSRKALEVPSSNKDAALGDLNDWRDKVLRWGALRKFNSQTIPAHLQAFVRAELNALPAAAPRSARKAVFTDAAYTLGNWDVLKAYDNTEYDFIEDLEPIISSGNNGDISAAKLRGQMNSTIRRFGLIRLREGMNAVGKDPESFDAEVIKAFREWQTEQQGFVNSFVDEVTKAGIGPDEVRLRADMWNNRTLESARELGMKLGNVEAMLKWVEDGTDDKCPDCLRLNGQVHSMAKWLGSGYTPTSGATQCQSFQCRCSLQPTDEPESGGF